MAIAALSTKNPYYIQREIDWTMMRDAYGGERYIKEKGQEYLPATVSMIREGMAFGQAGFHSYQGYRGRAVYHELVRPSLMAMLGVMHKKPPTINLPKKLEPLRNSATFNGEGLGWLMQKINEQQMLMGRYGIMLDVAHGAGPTALPYIVGYNAEQIVNWDSSRVGDDQGKRALQLVILNETDFERRAGLAWVQTMRYRILARAGDVRDMWDVGTKAMDNEYIAAEVRHTQDATAEDFEKVQLAGKSLTGIPFVFIGPRDLAPEPDLPVLLPMARLTLAIYRTEADYRQTLFMQGQDTLVVVGQQADASGGKTQVGAFGSIDLPIGGDAKYIGADSGGISDMESSIQNDLKRAAQLGAQLLTERGNEAEAASALNIRVASRTATLTTVAQAGAAGLEIILKRAAEWVGADPSQVSVIPNMDFADAAAMAQDAVYLMTAKKMGLPLSKQSIHGWLVRNEFTDLDFEQEQNQIELEGPDMSLGTPGVAGVQGPPTDALSAAGGKPKPAAPAAVVPPTGAVAPAGRKAKTFDADHTQLPDDKQTPGNKSSRQRDRDKDKGGQMGGPGIGGVGGAQSR